MRIKGTKWERHFFADKANLNKIHRAIEMQIKRAGGRIDEKGRVFYDNRD